MTKAYNIDLEVKGQHPIWIMNVRDTHRLMVIHPCAKYGKPMSNQKKVMGRTRKHVKKPINLTLRSKFKVVSGS